MRRQGLASNHLVVFIHTNEFRPQDRQYAAERSIHLPVPTADTGRLTAAASRVLEAIYRPGYSYKKAGVMLLGLGPAGLAQAGLFDAPDSPKSKALMTAIDALNGEHGRGAIRYAVAGTKQGWKLRSEYISPPYTTSWADLLKV